MTSAESNQSNLTLLPLESKHTDVTHHGEEVTIECDGGFGVTAEVFREKSVLDASRSCSVTVNSTFGMTRLRGPPNEYEGGCVSLEIITTSIDVLRSIVHVFLSTFFIMC